MELVGKVGSGDSEEYGARRQGGEGCAVRMYNVCESPLWIPWIFKEISLNQVIDLLIGLNLPCSLMTSWQPQIQCLTRLVTLLFVNILFVFLTTV